MKPNFIITHRGALGDFLLTWPTLIALRWKYSSYYFIGLGKPEYLNLAVEVGLLDKCMDSESQELLPFYKGESLPKCLLPMDMFLGWLNPEDKFVELLEQSNLKKLCVYPPFPKTENHHVIDHHLQALKSFNIKPLENKTLYLPLTTEVKDRCLIHPGSGSKSKNFEPEFYEFVANELKNKNIQDIYFLIGPADKEIKPRLGNQFKIIEPESVQELAQTLSGSKLFIGNDSGVSHLAGILGVQTIALFKSTNPRVWGVSGVQVENIEAPTEAQAMAHIQKITAKIFS